MIRNIEIKKKTRLYFTSVCIHTIQNQIKSINKITSEHEKIREKLVAYIIAKETSLSCVCHAMSVYYTNK